MKRVNVLILFAFCAYFFHFNDTRFFKPALYQLSYLAIKANMLVKIGSFPFEKQMGLEPIITDLRQFFAN